MIVQSLATALHGSRAITLHVRTSVGQVAAAVQESTGPGPGAWLPAAQPPASNLVIPGLSGTDWQPRPLRHGARGEGRDRPGHRGDVAGQLRADRRHRHRHPRRVRGGDPAAVAVRRSRPRSSCHASAPVTAAAVLIPGGAAGAPGSFTAAAPALEEQGVLADNAERAGRASRWCCPRPAGAARVSVAEIAAGGHRPPAHPGRARSAAAHSVVVPLTAVPGTPASTPFAVVITPLAGSGPVYAGRVIMANGGHAPVACCRWPAR